MEPTLQPLLMTNSCRSQTPPIFNTWKMNIHSGTVQHIGAAWLPSNDT